ncbi:RHS repeat protein [Escherichia coli]|nr:RHS repeat protein [Escherichia coli]
MSGKPAARQGDMTQYGGSIVQGSAGVRIGAPTGVACSVCPGGVTSGHPVNPLLGAKVLPGETDIALPGPLPFILSRTYSSYRTKTPAPVGSLGPGWKMPADIRLQLRDNTLILSDNGGRSLYFEHLFPGEDGYSRSESLWLVRGGVAKLDEGHRLAALWQALPEELRLSPHRYLATNSPQGPWWVLGWCERVVHYTRTQYAEPLVESRYLYDPLGRRVAKRVWRRERDLTGWMSLSRKPQVTWYGWDGDRLTTIQNDRSRIQTIYQPGSFTPLIRVETATGELARTQRRSLADALQQSGGEDGGSVVFPPVLVQMLDRLESEILADRVSEESRRWLASCGLTVEQMQNQMDPVYTPARKIHLYHCDHRGLPLALISTEGATAWCAEYDEWGNLLNEENPHQLQQLIRLPGQQYDEESGLYYNRHRYYDPLQGRYITQDPIGLKGGWNLYGYQLNPISDIDPLGLSMWEDAKSGACTNGLCGTLSAMIGPDKFDSIDSTAYDALNKINSQSICEDKEFAGLICKDNSGRYFSTAPNRGERKGSYPFNSPCPNGTEKVSAYHTHGADSHGEYWDEIFSGKDEKIVKSKDNNIKSFYLGTPSGNFKAIDNHGKEITNRKGLPNVCRVHGNM